MEDVLKLLSNLSVLLNLFLYLVREFETVSNVKESDI